MCWVCSHFDCSLCVDLAKAGVMYAMCFHLHVMSLRSMGYVATLIAP